MPTMTVDIAELGEIVGENARLKKQVDDLQESNTRLVEARRDAEARLFRCEEILARVAGSLDRIDRRSMVRAFHRAGDHPVLDVPQVPPLDRLRLRVGLVGEEFVEMLEALLEDDVSRGGAIRHRLAQLRGLILDLLNAVTRDNVDLPEVADAWADLVYVIDGAALEFGVDLDAVFRGVHEANLRKFGPGSWKREDGKQQKPPGWEPFDVAAELRRQGMKP